MGMTQEGQKCIFMLCMEVAEEDMEMQEERVQNCLILTRPKYLLIGKAFLPPPSYFVLHFYKYTNFYFTFIIF